MKKAKQLEERAVELEKIILDQQLQIVALKEKIAEMEKKDNFVDDALAEGQ